MGTTTTMQLGVLELGPGITFGTTTALTARQSGCVVAVGMSGAGVTAINLVLPTAFGSGMHYTIVVSEWNADQTHILNITSGSSADRFYGSIVGGSGAGVTLSNQVAIQCTSSSNTLGSSIDVLCVRGIWVVKGQVINTALWTAS